MYLVLSLSAILSAAARATDIAEGALALDGLYFFWTRALTASAATRTPGLQT